MKRVLIMVIMLTAYTASGQWAGWPLGTNYTFYGVHSVSDPVSQLWYAAGERVTSEPGFQVNNKIVTFSWDDTAGTNTQLIAVGATWDGGALTNTTDHVLTNYLLASTSLTWTVDMVAGAFGGTNSNDIMHREVYTYTDSNGTFTATSSLPYLGGIAQYGLTRHGVTILPSIDYFVFSEIDEVDDVVPMQRYVVTNHATAGSYNAWFARANSDGARPQDFVHHNLATLSSYEGIGYATNLQTNTWGDVIGSTVTNSAQYYTLTGMAWFTTWPTSAVNWQLAEVTRTGAVWTFREQDRLGTNNTSVLNDLGQYYFGEATPVLRYYGTNSGFSVSVTVTGQAYRAEIANPYRYLATVSDTVTHTGGVFALTGQYYKVTSISPASGVEHDGYAVIYTNEMAMYSEPEAWVRLYDKALDERWKALHAMLWSDVDLQTDFEWTGTANYYIWRGTGATWAAAIAACSNDTPEIQNSILAPLHYTQGKYVGGDNPYEAYAYARECYAIIGARTVRTNYSRQADFYTALNKFGTWSDQGDSYHQDIFSNIVDSGIGIHSAITSAAVIGDTAFPPQFPATPTEGTDTFKGWQYGSNLALIKWDVTDGAHPEFRYQNE